MHVYLTNDDGIMAPGLGVLAQLTMAQHHRVTIIAPEENASGKSQAITVNGSLTVRTAKMPGGIVGHAVSGTPADCMRLVFAGYFGELPDVVLSGVNNGINVGEDIFLSGTVGAASWANIRGIPSIAFSSASPNWDLVRRLLDRHFNRLMEISLVNPDLLYNVNLPSFGGEDAEWTRLGLELFTEKTVRIGRQGESFEVQIAREFRENCGENSDVEALRNGKVSITPIRWNDIRQRPQRAPIARYV